MDKVEAAPELIGPLKSLLDSPEGNRRKLDSLKREKPDALSEMYPGGILYTKGRRYFILDQNKNKVTYYMEWQERKILGKSAAYQVLVWRDTETPQTRALAHFLFFEFLFKDYDLVVTDRMQTPLGKRFWEIALVDALVKGYHLYIVDLLKDTTEEVFSLGEVLERADYIWPQHQVGQSRLLAIAKNKLW